MSKQLDPRDVLDFLWDRNLIEGVCVYDGRSRWRDAYHGSTHKSYIAPHGYYYVVDTPDIPGDNFKPRDVDVPEHALVVTLGYAARTAFNVDPTLARQLADTVGASTIEAAPLRGDALVLHK